QNSLFIPDNSVHPWFFVRKLKHSQELSTKGANSLFIPWCWSKFASFGQNLTIWTSFFARALYMSLFLGKSPAKSRTILLVLSLWLSADAKEIL
ncbi:MAG TPA: hypothetical protein VJ453_00985, partial [Terriglobales bacterium]|nr:hypothetical protein [Terriglobales bacterium]